MQVNNEKIAMGQIVALPTIEENLEQYSQMIDEAAEKGAKLILFPEVGFYHFFPQRHFDTSAFDLAQPIPGPITDFLSKKAKQKSIVVVASILEEGYKGEYYDSAFVIDADGSLLGTSRMMHVFDGMVANEKFYYGLGDTDWPVYETAAGKLGLAICYDSYYPEAVRCLALNGAEIILVPTMTCDEMAEAFPPTDFADNAVIEMIEFVQKSNAFCNGVFVAWCNRAGKEERNTMSGHSMVFDPYGRILASANTKTSEVLVTDVDFEKIRTVRKAFHLMSDRRPDSYAGVLKQYGSEPYYDSDRVTGRKAADTFCGKNYR